MPYHQDQRRRLSIALLIVLIAGISYTSQAAESKSASKTKHVRPPQTESAAKEQQSIPYKYGTEEAPIFVKIINAPTDDVRPSKNEQPTDNGYPAELWMVWLTGALTVIGAIQAGMFAWQLAYMRDGLKDAEQAAGAAQKSADAAIMSAESFHRLERAYLYLNVVWQNFEAVTNQSGTNKPIIDFTVINLGRTPAVVSSISVWVDLVSREALVDGINYGLNTVITEKVIAPNAEHERTRAEFKGVFTKDSVSAIRSGETYIRVYGMICYHDVFGTHHVTAFFMLYNGQRNELGHYEELGNLNYRT